MPVASAEPQKGAAIMSKRAPQSAGPPVANPKGFQERKLLQVELMGHDSQLRSFTPLRDRLVASGQDANAMYRKIEARRDQVMAELKKLTPAPVRPAPGTGSILRPGGSVLSLPIAPARFPPPNYGPWFGFSGTVQMGPAAEWVTVVPSPGKYPTSGSIYTLDLDATGGITFDGDLDVGPDAVPPDQYDPSLQYFWLHSWINFLLFPSPVVTSLFTYSFDVEVVTDLTFFGNGSHCTLNSFISVGETANLVDADPEPNTDAGWPLSVDLSQPESGNAGVYNGTYGRIQGQATVQRSFVVEAGQTPAVVVVFGMVSAQAMMSEVTLDLPGTASSSIIPGWFPNVVSVPGESARAFFGLPTPWARMPGLVHFNYNPLPLVVAPLP
jgi:hypothetical protein